MGKADKSNAMRALDRLDIAYGALHYDSGGQPLDAGEVAALLQEAPQRVCKTLVLEGSDRQHYVCVLPGPLTLDLKAAAQCFGVKSLQMLAPGRLRDVTGYVRGGCSPLAMKKKLSTAVEESALQEPYLVVSGGRIGLQIRLMPGDLLRAAEAKAARLALAAPQG